MKLTVDEPLSYGDEEGDFYIQHVHRTKPFGRNNHFHPTYEIYYLVSGQRVHFIEDRSYSITSGDLVLVNKQVVHNSSEHGPPEHERIVINFSDAFLGTEHPLYDPLLLQPFGHNALLLHLTPQEQVFVRQLLGKMITESSEQRPGFESYLRLLLTELLLFAARLPAPADSDAAKAEQPTALHQKISEVALHINEHYDTKLALADLAKQFYMSPYYLSRSFKTVTGFTLIEYVHLTRIREAQRLLKETDLKVIVVAERTGFENTGHFDRIFKKMTGLTPLAYRKMNPL
ncbi:AraC family transcriptional regulator [Paenibacillus sp. CF384]|uniref:helix-turn-helix transcriptional regulator n=1 Tax=Paenibacillus sp. CF384 TaxID=1884382 RepID=UPI000896EFBE|nr:AraC family transcriptional regulator [Paenibacillus sp. CF384]SDX45726.1 AraC-type DNA-binding protein [Paenibacillus sp. CF384]